MKKEILMLAASLMSIACEMTLAPDQEATGERMTLYFTGEKPDRQADVKTYYDPASNSILWSQSGEYMMVAMSNSAETEVERYDKNVLVPKRALEGILQSNEAVVSDDGKTAKFSLTEKNGITFPTGKGKYRFHSVYPASASRSLGNVSIWDWLIDVGTYPDGSGQFPTATSYDPRADVMLGISQQEYTEVTSDMEIPMIFERLVTHGKITLTNIPSQMTNITKAVITAPEGCTMAGIYYINVLGKEFGGDDKSNYNYVVLNYTSSEGGKVKAAAEPGQVVDGTFDLWFCTKPFEILEGQPLTISLYNETGCVSRQILARSEGIKFEKNKLSCLTISMASASYSDYTYEISMTPDGEKVDKLELPRTAGVTEFYVRTNAGTDLDFDYSAYPNLLSLYKEWDYKQVDSRGWNVMKCIAVHKENNSRTTKNEGSVTVNINGYGTYEPVVSSALQVSQNAGDGQVVIGDWTGDPVEMAGLLWYPCNLGFNLEHPFGEYYQWGRRAGQYPYCEDNTTKFAYSEYDDTGAIKAVDDKTYYAASNNWFKYDDPETDQDPTVDFNWSETDNSPYLGMGNPCPEGWRVPTTAEWEALSKLISSYGCHSTVGLKDKLHGVASFEGKTSSGKAAVWDLWDPQTGAALEFCVAGSISCSNTDTEEYFKNMDNAALNRYDSDNARGQYWASDTTEDENYSYRNYSYMDFTADNITGENTSYKKNEAAVRTISGVSYHGFSVRCVKSIE